MIRLIENPEQRKRLGNIARQTAASYTWDVYAQSVAALYEKFPASSSEPPRFADTYDEHMAPRPIMWKARQKLEQASLVVRAHRRCIGGASDSRWLRFPFYHHVFSDERRGFARHMDEMRKYGEFISLDQAVSLLESGTAIDGRYFCLTFDDGFRNTLSNGLPILMERNIPAAIFVVSDLIVNRAGDHSPEHDRFFGPHRRPTTFLTWEDCRILIESGMTIGSHSARHRRFVTLSDEEAEQELSASKKRIEERLGVPCAHFCCPWGKPGRDFVVERDPILAQRLGYRSFLTTKWGHMSGGESPYAIRRVGLLARYGLAQLHYFLSM
ncbi:Chitooligosaccharide deacetylase [Azospirillaceae bacterium]